jgi:hypothetical protein
MEFQFFIIYLFTNTNITAILIRVKLIVSQFSDFSRCFSNVKIRKNWGEYIFTGVANLLFYTSLILSLYTTVLFQSIYQSLFILDFFWLWIQLFPDFWNVENLTFWNILAGSDPSSDLIFPLQISFYFIKDKAKFSASFFHNHSLTNMNIQPMHIFILFIGNYQNLILIPQYLSTCHLQKYILYHFDQFRSHASHLIFFDLRLYFILDLLDFLEFFEKITQSLVTQIEKNGTVYFR